MRESKVRESKVGELKVRESKERESKERESDFIGQPEDENDEAFGSSIGFPTDRRPCGARRAIDESTPKADVAAWLASSRLRVGSHLSAEERERVPRVLYT